MHIVVPHVICLKIDAGEGLATDSAFVCTGYLCISIHKTPFLEVSDTDKISATLYVSQSLLRMK